MSVGFSAADDLAVPEGPDVPHCKGRRRAILRKHLRTLSGNVAEQLERHWYLKLFIGLATIIKLLALLVGSAWAAARLLWPLRWHIGAAVVCIELWFYICWYRKQFDRLNRQPAVHRPAKLEADALFNRFLRLNREQAGAVDVPTYLSVWFKGAQVADIKRGNVEELMAYGFHYCTLEQMEAQGRGEVPGQMVEALEAVWGIKFPPGYNPQLSFMGHLWEPLRASYRPLLFYAAMEVPALFVRLIMAGFGFRRHSRGRLVYYTLGLEERKQQRLPSDAASSSDGGGSDDSSHGGAGRRDPTWTPFALASAVAAASKNPLHAAFPHGFNTPILFLHGVGGLPLYLEMISYVLGLGNPVLAVEMKHVSLRLCSRLPTVDEVVADVVAVLDRCNVQRACVVGHSYGTFVASVLAREHKERVQTLCLIDPVCFGMFMPHLLHNFVYRRPQVNLRCVDVMLRDLVLYFASRDLHLAASFARNFYWTDLNLWPEDMPPGSVVLLSGNDDLLHAEEVRLMLESAGHIKVLYNPRLFHGAFLLDAEAKHSILKEIKAMLVASGSLVMTLTQPVVHRTRSFVARRSASLTDRLGGGGAARRGSLELAANLVHALTSPQALGLRRRAPGTHDEGAEVSDMLAAAHLGRDGGDGKGSGGGGGGGARSGNSTGSSNGGSVVDGLAPVGSHAGLWGLEQLQGLQAKAGKAPAAGNAGAEAVNGGDSSDAVGARDQLP